MHIKKNGYVGGAVLFLPTIRKMRAHVEFEKFLCRVIKDDERTRDMQLRTEQHPDKLYNMRYNNENSNKLTVAGKKNNGN